MPPSAAWGTFPPLLMVAIIVRQLFSEELTLDLNDEKNPLALLLAEFTALDNPLTALVALLASVTSELSCRHSASPSNVAVLIPEASVTVSVVTSVMALLVSPVT